MIQNLEQHYKVLGLEPGASLEEVNQAYKDLVFIWHPDRVPQDNERLVQKSVAKLQQINEARDSLRSYHRKYRKATAKAPASSSPARPSTYPRRENYGERNAYQNRDRYARRDSYQAYSRENPKKHQGDREASQRYRSSTYSQTNPRRATDYKSKQPWDYRAYYYSPNNPNNQGSNQGSSNRDGYQDFHESSKSYGSNRPPESNHKRPYYKDLRGADLSRSNFKEKDFSGRDLSQADLSYADLSDTFLHKIVLEKANLQGANLKGANLLQATLRGANLKEANLIGADLSG
ncbi:MAG: pentapeptide repeat-containing protein, partial [Pleurocapsa sp.]